MGGYCSVEPIHDGGSNLPGMLVMMLLGALLIGYCLQAVQKLFK